MLYKDLLPRAQEIVLRDPTSLNTVERYTGNGKRINRSPLSVALHEDFSLAVLRKFSLSPFATEKESFRVKGEARRAEGFKSSTTSWSPSFAKEDKIDIQHYVLVNINTATCTTDNIHKIQLFCQEHPGCKIIFFPCDMDDDYKCFDIIKSNIPTIEMYDWRKYSLEKTLQLFADTEAGIGSRLHFLLPLKFFNKPFHSIAKAEKVQKMLNS
jgi:polysaccharide pyruvyl transferase WcaK-like protein